MKSASSVLDEAAFLPLLKMDEQEYRKCEPTCACKYAAEDVAWIMNTKIDTACGNHAEHKKRKGN